MKSQPKVGLSHAATLHHYQRKEHSSSGKKEYFCPVCRVSVAGHPTSILLHNQSEQHIQTQKQIVTEGKRRPLTTTDGIHLENGVKISAG